MKFFTLFILAITSLSQTCFARPPSLNKACLGEIQFLETHGNDQGILENKLQHQIDLRKITYGASKIAEITGVAITAGRGAWEVYRWSKGEQGVLFKGSRGALLGTLLMTGALQYVRYRQNQAINCTQFKIDSIVNSDEDERISAAKILRNSLPLLKSRTEEYGNARALSAALPITAP